MPLSYVKGEAIVMSVNESEEVKMTEQPQDENEMTAVGETQDGEEVKSSQREREQNAINAVNDSDHFESRVNMSAYEVRHVTEGMKNAPKWGIALGLTFFFSLVADLIVATVLLVNRVFVGAIVCAAIFGVVIVTALICMIISRARAMNGDIRKAEKITEGKVKTCFMVGTTTVKSGGNSHRSSVRIRSVTYRVIVSADGEEYGAFSNRFYETGEKVTIAVMGKNRAEIVDETEPEKSDISKPEAM